MLEILKTPKLKNAEKTYTRAISTSVLTNSAFFLLVCVCLKIVFAENAIKIVGSAKNENAKKKTGPRLC